MSASSSTNFLKFSESGIFLILKVHLELKFLELKALFFSAL